MSVFEEEQSTHLQCSKAGTKLGTPTASRTSLRLRYFVKAVSFMHGLAKSMSCRRRLLAFFIAMSNLLSDVVVKLFRIDC